MNVPSSTCAIASASPYPGDPSGSTEFARPVNPEPARSNQSPSLSVLVPRRRPLIHPSRDRSGARRQPGGHLDDEMMRQGQVQPEEPRRPAEPAVHPAHTRKLGDISWVAAGFA